MAVDQNGRADRMGFDSMITRLELNPDFRSLLRGTVVPGTTFIVTDLPISGKRGNDLAFSGK